VPSLGKEKFKLGAMPEVTQLVRGRSSVALNWPVRLI
jgi:hypothetical protein